MSRYTTQAPKLALDLWRKRYPSLEPHQATAKHGSSALAYWLSCLTKARAKVFR